MENGADKIRINPGNIGSTERIKAVVDVIEFKADGGFSTTVLLKRQVAGVLGYFSRIPATVGEDVDKKNVTGIRLVSSN